MAVTVDWLVGSVVDGSHGGGHRGVDGVSNNRGGVVGGGNDRGGVDGVSNNGGGVVGGSNL